MSRCPSGQSFHVDKFLYKYDVCLQIFVYLDMVLIKINLNSTGIIGREPVPRDLLGPADLRDLPRPHALRLVRP